MRKLFTAVVLGTFATAALASNGQFRGHDPKTSRSDAGLTAPSTAAAGDVVKGYLKEKRTVSVKKQFNGKNGAKHVQMEQSIGGVPVYGAYIKATVDGSGRLTNIIDNTVDETVRVTRTTLTADAALNAALGHRYGNAARPAFYRAPLVTKVVVPTSDGGLEDGFLVETWELKSNNLWHTVVGASGAIAYQELRTASDSYFIFPINPGITPQTTVSGPGAGNTESPSGWVTTNTTIGNNVDAYLDRDNNNAADANSRPISSTNDFIYPFDGAAAPTTIGNQQLAVANLFYLNNVVHDKLYRHGFNEAAGNFQTNNFGKGGAGNDPVSAEGQDGGGTNNANFSTPADGSRGRMQMYLWNTATPNRDGDLDADVVFHEYGHGLTWRMIGSMGGGLAGSIGEGMSDVVACYITENDTVGEYVKNNTLGIRRYPYTNYPLTYRSANTSSVHANGEIYAASMWKLRALWLASGRTMDQLWDYVIDGMNFTPANPEMEEMRDGILAAMPTQAEDCVVWDAFSSFGIGLNAVGTDSCNILGNCTINITEDFNKPVACGGTAPAYTLTVSGAVSGGRPKSTLNWTGGTGANVDVFRNSAKITTTANDGNYVDQLAKNTHGTFTYKVCNAGTTTCSNDASVTY
jgi:extracellular elastinolytic metalloproteinase